MGKWVPRRYNGFLVMSWYWLCITIWTQTRQKHVPPKGTKRPQGVHHQKVNKCCDIWRPITTHIYIIYIWLVVYLPLWKIWVGMMIPNIWKNKTCSKPPNRYTIYIYIHNNSPACFLLLFGPSLAITAIRWRLELSATQDRQFAPGPC